MAASGGRPGSMILLLAQQNKGKRSSACRSRFNGTGERPTECYLKDEGFSSKLKLLLLIQLYSQHPGAPFKGQVQPLRQQHITLVVQA